MPKISKISRQQKREDWCSIFVDDSYAFSLPVGVVADTSLRVGDELSEPQLNDLKQLSDWNKNYESAIRKLARRPHSRREIIDYLRRRKATEEDIEAILSKLDGYGYLDDRRFAEQWVRERRQLKHRSTKQLRNELFKKGIGRGIIDSLLSETDDDQRQALQKVIEKKRHQSRYQDREKLIQYLLRQGFEYQLVKEELSGLQD